jgi:transcriptional regulator with XRE-family HTH domain
MQKCQLFVVYSDHAVLLQSGKGWICVMELRDFIKARRLQLGLSQAKLAERLSLYGEETSSARVGHWETGRNYPPIEDKNFLKALANALELNVNDLIANSGIMVPESGRSKQALRAADILDQLPPEQRDLALNILEQFLKSNYAATI